MANIRKIPYRLHDHLSFEEEWQCHKRISEWWYVTGYFSDETDKLYSYQFTVIRTPLAIFTPNILMLALTDFSTEKHYYSQKTTLLEREISIDRKTVQYGDAALITKGERGMRLTGSHRDFSLDLELDYGKGAFWHCDNGALRMGVDEPKETTLYFSYPNMPTKGSITLGGRKIAVKGKSWFDKQGGPYSIINRKTHWEWFSLRFFDDEEMMLFTFPQDDYQDGTFIPCEGPAKRLNQYSIKPLDFITINEMKFSSGWSLRVPELKEEEYIIRPLMKGQVNLAYCEQLAGIYNAKEQKVGLCFVELLPGVYNEKFSSSLFKKVG